MEEIWQPIEGFEDSHEVSIFGRVRTIEREWVGVTPTGHPARRLVKSHICTQRIAENGYMRVALCRDGKPFSQSVHRLVAKAFVPPTDGCEHINHKNGNKQDNRSENLEWVTPSMNMRHAQVMGLQRVPKGSARAMAKLTEDQVREIRRLLAAGVVQRRIAEQFGVAYCKITMIKQGTAWKHVA